MDGLKGFPRAIEAAFPQTQQTQVQTRIGYLLRHSMSFACYKDRNAVDAGRQKLHWPRSRTAI